ncbi:MAG: hypothetical protein JOZ36_05095, partial [Acidobacteria bacterium]|nr:hypothetical protein [Acidobacteriota bacterium]
MKSRAEVIEKARSIIAELQATHSLALRTLEGGSLYEEAAAMRLPKTVFSPP